MSRPGPHALRRPLADGFACLAGLHVVIVADDPRAASLLATVVEYCGGWATTSPSRRAAEQLLRHVMPHLVVIATAGTDLERRGALAGVPALAVTSDATDAARERCLAAGFQGWLPQPVDFRAFSRAVARLARDPAAGPGP